MGGYFPCFGSSNKNGVNSVKEVAKKESLKEGLVAQSHHVNRVSSAKSKSRGGIDLKKEQPVPKDGSTAHIAAQTFTFVSLLLPQRTLDPNACSVRVGSAMFTRVVWIQDRGILASKSLPSLKRNIISYASEYNWGVGVWVASYDQSVEFFRDSVGLGEVSTVVGASAVSGLAAAACSMPTLSKLKSRKCRLT